ncbi:MAG: molecular chaperone HtpG, partial [Victivallaceae bacterium]
MAEKQQFKTEVQHLLNLMIHSLYSNKDIFLRELIANAADAIDKARFESLTRPELAKEWAIHLNIDKENHILTISDNGIGMTQAEVIENIGTIAKSGTKAFVEKLKSENSANLPELIGQFGVGFYSVFMVADQVELTTKKAGEDSPAIKWSSSGEDSFEIDSCDKEEPGTTITIKIKPECELYLDDWKVSEIVKRYSDFIEYPIIMPQTKYHEEDKTTVEDTVLNSQKAIWLRKASEITEEEHESFFAHVSHQPGKPLQSILISAEGTNEFKALLYIPEKAPFTLFMPDLQKKGLQLYIKRVFITDECKELIPDYLRFVKGVVDSSDLPLNVSREILQDNPLLKRIEKSLTTKVLGELKKLKENQFDKYKSFFQEFGKTLKEGIHTDFANQDKIKDLALYETMNGKAGELISLQDYISTMPESQKDIYFILAESRTAAENSPALEIFRRLGYDVLFMTDPIDEWIMQSMLQYDKHHFKPAAKGELALDGDEKNKLDQEVADAGEKYAKLVEFITGALSGKVSKVRFSGRLTDSVSCLVSEEGAMSPHMERMFKAMNQELPPSERILELNPTHPLVAAMEKVYEKDPTAADLADFTSVIYDQALLAEGSPISDVKEFSRKISNLMVR